MKASGKYKIPKKPDFFKKFCSGKDSDISFAIYGTGAGSQRRP